MSDDPQQETKGLLSSALLVAAVALVLVMGFVLKSDRKVREQSQTPPAPPVPTLGSIIEPETAAPSSSRSPEAEGAPPANTTSASGQPPAPSPAASPAPLEKASSEPKPRASEDPLLVKLATRAERDRARIAKAQGRWTAQLLLACQPANAERILSAGAGSSKLFVLPAHVKEDACFRVCFGSYATSKDAAAAADLPKSLRGKDKIVPVEIAKVLL